MANNRMYLICRVCEARNVKFDFHNVQQRPFFSIAKWYPGTPWYSNREDNESFNGWLEVHSHDLEFPFRFEYEVPQKPGDVMVLGTLTKRRKSGK